MDKIIISEIIVDLIKAIKETFLMCGISLVLAILIGIPLGLFLYLTEKEIFYKNRFLNTVGGLIINVIRSTPFVILLVVVLPITQKLTGSTIGPLAASVPLSLASIAFFSRLVHGALLEVDKGVLEASIAMGADLKSLIKEVLIPEAFPGLIRGLTVTAISLVGYSAMAGIVGGGGIGDLAIRFGYYRYETKVMIITVTFLIILVQIIQIIGDLVAKKSDKK